MSAMVRKTVYIEPGQSEMVKRLAGEMGITESAVIREAIDWYGNRASRSGHDPEAWKRIRAFLQSLIDQGPIEGGGRTWHREDLYDV